MPLRRLPDEGTTSGSTRAVDAEQRQQLVVPLARVEVEQHRPRRVRQVGDVRRAAGQLPDEPGVDRPEGQLPLRPLGAPEDPLELRRREVRVGDEPRPLADQRRRQLRAAIRGAPVLPHDRAVHRPAGTALPHHGRLALVRDPDRVEVAGVAPAAASASAAAGSTLAQISSGSCSTHPGRGKCCPSSLYPRPITRSPPSTTRHVVPVVPWSIARITAVVDQHPSDASDG